MKWVLFIVTGLVIGCGAELDPVFLKNKSSGNIVKCGPYPVTETFVMSQTERRRCVQFFTDRGHIEIPAP